MLELLFRWNASEGRAQVELGVNDDPAALGCEEIARNFPYCRATVEHPGNGYADLLGWVQLVRSSWAPTLFDAPHTDENENWDFGPDLLAAPDWDDHLPFLGRTFPSWQFSPGFHRHPLDP